jgi:colicin import membrane protein
LKREQEVAENAEIQAELEAMLSAVDQDVEATLQEPTSPAPMTAKAGPSKRKATEDIEEEIEEEGLSSSRKKQKPLSKAEKKAAAKAMKDEEKAAAKAMKDEEKAAAKAEARAKKAEEKAAAKGKSAEERKAAKEQAAAEVAGLRAPEPKKMSKEEAKKAQEARAAEKAAEEKKKRLNCPILALEDWKAHLVKSVEERARAAAIRKANEQEKAQKVAAERAANLVQVASGNVQQFCLDDDVVGYATWAPMSSGMSLEDAICID